MLDGGARELRDKRAAVGGLPFDEGGHHKLAPRRVTHDAGIQWLSCVAGLNPATSRVIREWDSSVAFNHEMRADLLALFKEHRGRRREQTASESRLAEPVLQ